MKLLQAQQIRQLDQYNIKECGVCSIDLMEQASLALSAEVEQLFATDRPMVVFAGPGNNGGDGLAIARLLGQKGYRVEVFLFNTNDHLSPDCEQNKIRLQEADGIRFVEITSQLQLPRLEEKSVVIDALFGTGLSRPLAGGYCSLVDFLNKGKATIVSVDMPSGMMDVCEGLRADNPSVVEADYTFTFHCLKPCMLLADNQKYLGRLKVLDIGLKDEHIDYSSLEMSLISEAGMASILKWRNPFGHKGSFGHGLLVSGAYGMAGASVLAAKAALRSGLGKLTLHLPKNNLPIVQTAVPEAVVSIDVDENCIGNVDVDLSGYDAIAFGSGVGQNGWTEKALLSLLKSNPERLIVDADGLNLLAKHAEWPSLLPANTIITPHRKEWERLMGQKADDTTMFEKAMEYASKHSIYIVLKGHHTAIFTPQGRVYFNTTGNCGMATAGSGDVLTGILLSLLSQGYCEEDACRLGVWLHGAAGDYAANKMSEYCMIASDIIKHIKDAFKVLLCYNKYNIDCK